MRCLMMIKPKEHYMTKMKVIAVLTLGLLSSAAVADDKWTSEENAAGLKQMEYTRYAFAGKLLRLRPLYALNMDCSPFEGYQFAVIKAPEHGTAEVVPHTFFPTFAKDNPRSKCNEKQIDAQALVYQPNDNYEGRDSFVFLELSPSGYATEVTYTFNVRLLKDKPKVTSKK
jgi:hypothetical protein